MDKKEKLNITIIFCLYYAIELYLLEIKKYYTKKDKILVKNILYDLKILRNTVYKFTNSEADLDWYEQNGGEMINILEKQFPDKQDNKIKFDYCYHLINLFHCEIKNKLLNIKKEHLNQTFINLNVKLDKFIDKTYIYHQDLNLKQQIENLFEEKVVK